MKFQHYQVFRGDFIIPKNPQSMVISVILGSVGLCWEICIYLLILSTTKGMR